MIKRLLVILLGVLVGACSGANDVERTLVAQQELLGTSIADLKLTATAETDQMMITIEHAQTEVRSVNSVGTVLAATLVARGINPDAISGNAPLFITPTPTPGPTSAPQPLTTAEAGSPPAPTTQAATLSNIVMAENVGPDDCAVNPSAQFSTTSEHIYVVGTAHNITPGMTISSVWQQGGVEQVKFDFTPDFPINGACIWFFIDQSDVSFTPGAWSVSLQINGQATSPPIVFNIVG